MSNFEKLTALGAESVGGDLIWKHKVLGHFRNGDLQLTEEGVKALEIDDVVVKEDKPKRKPKAEKPAELEVEIDDME
jgi:hypothetical protein